MAIRNQIVAEIEAARAQRAAAERQAEQERLASRRNASPLEAQRERERQFACDRQHQEAAELNRVKSRLRARYLAVPGASGEDFEAAFPGLLKRYREDRTVAGNDQSAANDHPFGDPQTWGLNR